MMLLERPVRNLHVHILKACPLATPLRSPHSTMSPPRIRLVKGARCLRRPPQRHLFHSTAATRQLELAFDLHEPEECRKNPGSCNAPIVFLHGLFGNKKNNRSISK